MYCIVMQLLVLTNAWAASACEQRCPRLCTLRGHVEVVKTQRPVQANKPVRFVLPTSGMWAARWATFPCSAANGSCFGQTVVAMNMYLLAPPDLLVHSKPTMYLLTMYQLTPQLFASTEQAAAVRTCA
jgi:hypothetical protein